MEHPQRATAGRHVARHRLATLDGAAVARDAAARPRDERRSAAVQAVEDVHFVRIHLPQQLHQRGTTTRVRGEDQAAARHPGTPSREANRASENSTS
jgi:hypothetical protein